MNNEPRSPYILRLACIFIVIVLLVTSLYYLKAVLVPMLFSIIFAVMLFPFSIRLEKWGLGKGMAAFSTVLITTLFLGFLIYLLFNQVSSFVTHVPQLSDKFDSIVNSIRDFAVDKFHLKKTDVADKIQQQLTQLQNNSGAIVSTFIAFLPAFLINLFMVPLYVFFLLYYRHFFLEFFYKVFYRADKTDIDETLDNLNHGDKRICIWTISRHHHYRFCQCCHFVSSRHWLPDRSRLWHSCALYYPLSRYDRCINCCPACCITDNHDNLATFYRISSIMGHSYLRFKCCSAIRDRIQSSFESPGGNSCFDPVW